MAKHIAEVLPADIKAIMDNDADRLAERYPHPLQLKKGDKAPLFELPNATGKLIKLDDLLKHDAIVLVFYRGSWCPYCNLILKSYQGVLKQIKEKGANLIAVSAQTPDQSLSIKEKNELQFEVLADAHNEVAKQYITIFKNSDAVIAEMKKLNVDFYSYYSDDSGEIPVPAVFIINKEGIITFAGSKGGDYRERVEPSEILEALDKQ